MIRRPETHRRDGAPFWGAVLLLAVWGLGGCAAPADAAFPDAAGELAELLPVARIQLVADGPGPAQRLFARVQVVPRDGRPALVAPADPAQGVLVELVVRWSDFPGDRPISSGRSHQVLVSWSEEQPAQAGAPAEAVVALDLPEPRGTLARRVEVQGRMIGVELRRGDQRSGGLVLPLTPARLDSWAPVPPGGLAAHLQSDAGRGIFLAAVSTSPEDSEAVLMQLIAALSVKEGAAREAILAALLFLTGETHGRDANRWRLWWDEQRRAP